MSRAIYMIGCGDHGVVVLNALLEGGAAVAGILDPGRRTGERILGIPVIGDDTVLETLDASRVALVNGVGANPRTEARTSLFLRLKQRGFAIHTVQGGGVIVGRECRIGEGSQLLAGVVLQPRVTLGENALINTRVVVEHDCTLEPHAVISPNATLCGNVTVGEAAFVGAAAVIRPGVIVGARAIVGMGSVVIEDVPDDYMVAGNPAKRITSTTPGNQSLT